MPTYTVHVYREMRVKFTGIEADSMEEAARAGADLRTDQADDVEDCVGANLSAVVDLDCDDDFGRTEGVAFEAGRMMDTGPEMLSALEELIANIDEDVPPEYVTRHFRNALEDARVAVAKAKGVAS
jgi:hypothetical protein